MKANQHAKAAQCGMPNAYQTDDRNSCSEWLRASDHELEKLAGKVPRLQLSLQAEQSLRSKKVSVEDAFHPPALKQFIALHGSYINK
jgi:hypothetical protein